MSEPGGEGVVEREIFILSPPEEVFKFLIDPDRLMAWFGIENDIDPRPGGKFEVEVSRGNVARGTYTEVIPFRRVAFTWGWISPDPMLAALRPGTSLVEIDLGPKDGGTLLRLRHSRLSDATTDIHGDRWSRHLAKLASAAPRRRKPAS